MPGTVLHLPARGSCPHATGQMTLVTTNTRVMVGGQPAATTVDTATIAGCVFNVNGKPQQCASVQWTPAARVKINGMPVVLNPGPHVCQSADQVPNGPLVVTYCQSRVIAT